MHVIHNALFSATFFDKTVFFDFAITIQLVFCVAYSGFFLMPFNYLGDVFHTVVTDFYGNCPSFDPK